MSQPLSAHQLLQVLLLGLQIALVELHKLGDLGHLLLLLLTGHRLGLGGRLESNPGLLDPLLEVADRRQHIRLGSKRLLGGKSVGLRRLRHGWSRRRVPKRRSIHPP